LRARNNSTRTLFAFDAEGVGDLVVRRPSTCANRAARVPAAGSAGAHHAWRSSMSPVSRLGIRRQLAMPLRFTE
jgi:hypothetical protein